jgi:hypothetical protein
VSQLADRAKSVVRDLDPTNSLTFLRVKSAKHEVTHIEPHFCLEVSFAKHEVSSSKQEVSSAKHEVTSAKYEVSSAKHVVPSAKHEVSSAKHKAFSAKNKFCSAKPEFCSAKHEFCPASMISVLPSTNPFCQSSGNSAQKKRS